MTKRGLRRALLAAVFLLSLVILNVLGSGRVAVGPFSVLAGILALIGLLLAPDLIGELWGRAQAERTVRAGFLTQCLLVILLAVTAMLPRAPETPEPVPEETKPAAVTYVPALPEDDGVATRTLHIQRFGRLLDRYVHEGRERVLRGQSVEYYDGLYYACGSYNDNKNQTVSVWDGDGRLVDYSSGLTSLRHANDMAATEDRLYIAGGGPRLSVVDRQSLEFVRHIPLPGFGTVYGVAESGGTLFFLGHLSGESLTDTICSLDPETGEYTVLCTFADPANKVRQGFTVCGDWAYLVYNQANMIYKIRLDTGVCEGAYFLPDGDDLNPVGEAEDLFVMDGRILLVSILFNSGPTFPGSSAAICQLFDTDLTGILEAANDSSSVKPQGAVSVTVDGEGEQVFNPTRRVTTVEEAGYILNYLGRGTMHIKNVTEGYLRLYAGRYHIRGAGAISAMELLRTDLTMAQTTVGSLLCSGARLSASACNIGGKADLEFSTVELTRTDLSGLTDLTVRMSDLTFKTVKGFDPETNITVTGSTACAVELRTAYTPGVLRLLTCCGASRGAAEVTVRTGTDPIFDSLTLAELSAADPVVHPLPNHPRYDQVIYWNGSVSVRVRRTQRILELGTKVLIDAASVNTR